MILELLNSIIYLIYYLLLFGLIFIFLIGLLRPLYFTKMVTLYFLYLFISHLFNINLFLTLKYLLLISIYCISILITFVCLFGGMVFLVRIILLKFNYFSTNFKDIIIIIIPLLLVGWLFILYFLNIY